MRHKKYDKIGVGYNLTRRADPFLTSRFMKHLAPKKIGLYLDIGCGTGNYTIEFQDRGFQFIGIDPSVEMLAKARNRNPTMDWRIGRAEQIELPDNSVDGVVSSLTIHHWTDIQKGFSELHRVLKENGRIVIFTSTSQQMKGYWLNHYFPQMLEDSIAQMPDLMTLKTILNSSKFETIGVDRYSVQPDLQDKFLYCGKHQAELYFDEQIRKGISSFSSLANQKEVKLGLAKLRTDMNTGKIKLIMKKYEHHLGDYLYLIGKKRVQNNNKNRF